MFKWDFIIKLIHQEIFSKFIKTTDLAQPCYLNQINFKCYLRKDSIECKYCWCLISLRKNTELAILSLNYGGFCRHYQDVIDFVSLKWRLRMLLSETNLNGNINVYVGNLNSIAKYNRTILKLIGSAIYLFVL